MSKLNYLSKHLKKYQPLIVILIICTIAYAGLNLCSSVVLSFLIDNVIDNQPINNALIGFLASILGGVDYIRDHLYLIGVVLIIIYVLVGLLIHTRQKLQGVISEGLVENIRNELYWRIESLPYAYYSKNKTGELIQKCTSDVDVVRRFFAGQFAEIFYIIATVFIAMSVLLSINAKLAIFTLIFVPFIFGYSYYFLIKIQKDFLASDETEAKMSTVIEESLSGVRVVKAFNRERYEIDKFAKINQEFHDVTYKVIVRLGQYYSTSYFMCIFSILALSLIGVIFVNHDAISLGDFVIFFNYQIMIVFPIRALGRILSDFGKMTVSLNRLIDIVKTDIEDLESGLKPDLKGDIEFKGINFDYGDDKMQVLNDINLKIKQGDTVAIVGSTGCGKSSLIHLLSRLYEPTSGEITINNVPIQDINKDYLRTNVALVLQEPFLFSRSIRDNLTIVKPDATEDELVQVCKIACVHDVIMSFEEGYDTIIGENGVTLSGGQKQRVAIARTLLQNASILVFDDSLSAVDTQTDALISANLKEFRNDLTKILITQRISSAKSCDLIVVMNEGKIEDLGTHEELIKKPGLYQRIYQIQNQYKLEWEEHHGK